MEEEEKKFSWDGIEKRVVSAYKEKGIRAAGCDVYPNRGACCALGALYWNESTGYSTDPYEDAQKEMGENYWRFYQGFDRGLIAQEIPDGLVGEERVAFDAGYLTALAVKEAGLVG